MKAAHRRSQELKQQGVHLHEQMLATAESVRSSYERTAETLAHLADTGPAEHARRRRRAAEHSRRLAEAETRDIAEMRRRESRSQVLDPGHRPDADHS
jgi:hypothetical protein